MSTQLWNANIHYHRVVLASIPPNAERVLDVGCGDGILTAELVDAGVPRVLGIDVDRPVLERARARHADKAIDWIHGDALELAFEPASFDAVVSVATLHHLDARRALARFAELVRPGGSVVVIGLAATAWRDLPFTALAQSARLACWLVRGEWRHSAPMCWPPPLTYGEMKALGGELLPGVVYRRHLLGRYSLVWRKPL
jgi:2-polyprenyl-3-methyl-5-hydroxy-6-metoxy-1,4-benzoquinol methylase